MGTGVGDGVGVGVGVGVGAAVGVGAGVSVGAGVGVSAALTRQSPGAGLIAWIYFSLRYLPFWCRYLKRP